MDSVFSVPLVYKAELNLMEKERDKGHNRQPWNLIRKGRYVAWIDLQNIMILCYYVIG